MALNYSNLPWTPTLKDMEAPQKLNAVKIKGEYASLKECVETHYRLMKEDFMRPLRAGIEKYKACRDIDSQSLRLYSNVRIVDIIFEDKVNYRLQFDPSSIVLDHWEICHQLANNSLLLLSCNNFESYFFAIVADSTEDCLMQGLVDVEFIADEDGLRHLLDSLSDTFVMAEYKTDYRSYSCILSALNQVKMCNRLQEYIIKCSRNLERPIYLTSKTKYDMSCIMNNKTTCSFEPLNPEAWPDFHKTCLNESQIAAVQLALTKELAVIRGPPGSGKTFVCCKIIQALLQNNMGPILVLCKTSDALDEILEWALEFCTSDILRCANRNKSGKLQRFNIQLISHTIKENHGFSKEYTSNFKRYARRLADISEQIAKCYHQMEQLGKEIQSPEVLIEHMNPNHRETVKRGKWSIQTVSDWLCEMENDEHENKRKFSTKNTEVMKALQELSKTTLLPMSEQEDGQVKNLKLLNLQQRLRLYKLWITKYRKQVSEKMAVLLHGYNTIHEKMSQIRKGNSADIFQNKALIGMTPKSAAYCSAELKTIRCRVVIVDDAASMFESYILAAISQWTEHLILVSDLQLAGLASTVAELNINYGLGVSLFERLVNNNIPYVQLNEQYQICPKIAELKRHMYPNLRDNECLLKKNEIKGISNSVFFINHNHKGNRCVETKQEVHACEADFLVGFCKYLLIMRHMPTKITILTTNIDQMLVIQEKMASVQLGALVFVTTVDEYEKRKDDIILLSFTRSKEEVATNLPVNVNQVSYAFSRAKCAFYAIGDFDSLKLQSKSWSNIIDSATASGNLADGLPLSNSLKVTSGEGFSMVISYIQLKADGSDSLKFDFSKLKFTIIEMKIVLFQLKCEYCIFRIGQMEEIVTESKKCNDLKDKVSAVTKYMTPIERDRLRSEISSLLYSVVITLLECLCLSDTEKFRETLKMPIMSWKKKLSLSAVDEQVNDDADDFVEAMMVSMMKGGDEMCETIKNIAERVDEINKILCSKDKQPLCDLVENWNSLKVIRKYLCPPTESSPRPPGKVIHGRQLYWYL